MDEHLWAEAKPWRHVSRWAARAAISSPEILSMIIIEVQLKCCFGQDSYLSNAISVALAYVAIGVC